MKFIFKKAMVVFTLMMSVMTTVHSSDTFSHTVLTLPDNPRNEDPWTLIINTQEEWESFFYSTTAHMTFLQSEAPIAPKLDFENYRVLTGGLGAKSSGGNILSVERVRELDDVIAVHVLVIQPRSTCASITMISYPSTTILVNKTDKPFKFTVTHSISECP